MITTYFEKGPFNNFNQETTKNLLCQILQVLFQCFYPIVCAISLLVLAHLLQTVDNVERY